MFFLPILAYKNNFLQKKGSDKDPNPYPANKFEFLRIRISSIAFYPRKKLLNFK